MIDICLEQQLDLPEAGKYAALARGSLPAALADKKAGPSWQDAAFDVQLRVGLVSFCQGKGTVAAEAFAAAAKVSRNKTLIESLDALITAAKASQAVIPSDCTAKPTAAGRRATPASRVATALSLAIINTLAGRPDNANAFFDRVLGRPATRATKNKPGQPALRAMPGSTLAQRAFATFGRGMILQSQRLSEPAQALQQFHASIKAFSAGTWHDETLYRIATLTQVAIEAKFAQPAPGQATTPRPAKADKAAKPAKAGTPTPTEKAAAAQAEKQRLAALLKAKTQLLSYWQELIKRYPKSPRREPATYNTGVLLYEIAATTSQSPVRRRASQTTAAWKTAAAALKAFTESYPKSPWTGDAHVRQIDIALERLSTCRQPAPYPSKP